MIEHRMILLVLQLAVIIITTRLLGLFFQRVLKQTRVLGELAAGMLIGPYALGSLPLPLLHGPLFPLGGEMAVSAELYGFAVVASIVLLFLAGLETDLPTFLRFSGVGSVVGFGGAALAFVLANIATVLVLPTVNSFMHPTALLLGTVAMATSVGLSARILSEKRQMSSPEGVTILAAAVFDDVISIVFLAIVIGISRMGGGTDWAGIGVIAAKAVGFWLGFTLLGVLLAPKLTKRLKKLKSIEVIAGTAFGLALFMSGLSELAGLAMVIGAYVTGLSLSQTDLAHDIRERLRGFHEVLVPVFFAVMGMLVDFRAAGSQLGFALVFTVAAIVGKLVGCGLPALVSGFNLRGALRVGAGMLPRGEVTLITAGIGLASGAIGADLFGVPIFTLLVATIVAPPLMSKLFEGGSGRRVETTTAAGPSLPVAFSIPVQGRELGNLVRGRITQAFRDEEFFVSQVDAESGIYQIRKDDTAIAVIQSPTEIRVQCAGDSEPFVRLVLIEQIIELKDLVEGLDQFRKPEDLGRDLMSGLFN